MTGAPYLARFSRDVGFHGCPPVTLYWQQVFMSMVIYTLYAQGPKVVESHISRKTSEMWGTRHSLQTRP